MSEPRKKWTTTLNLSKNEISEQTKKSMKTRIITSIVLAVLFIPAVFLGGWYFIGIIFVVSLVASFEFVRATKLQKRYWPLYVLVAIFSLLLTFWFFIKRNIGVDDYAFYELQHWNIKDAFQTVEISTMLLVFTLITLFSLLIMDQNFNFDIASYLFLLILFIGIGMQSFLFIRFFPSKNQASPALASFLLIYIVLGTFMNDIGAYFVGVLYGKTKMVPNISPNKTWEGFVGGVLISFIVSFLFAMISSLAGAPILQSLSHKKWYWLILLSFLMPLFANVGDLFFSATKRHLKIKDYGSIIVGHGGVLDRIDSLILVSLITSMLVILIENNWSLLA